MWIRYCILQGLPTCHVTCTCQVYGQKKSHVDRLPAPQPHP